MKKSSLMKALLMGLGALCTLLGYVSSEKLAQKEIEEAVEEHLKERDEKKEEK